MVILGSLYLPSGLKETIPFQSKLLDQLDWTAFRGYCLIRFMVFSVFDCFDCGFKNNW